MRKAAVNFAGQFYSSDLKLQFLQYYLKFLYTKATTVFSKSECACNMQRPKNTFFY